MVKQETYHWESEGRSGCPVLEPYPGLLLTKSGQLEIEVHY